MNQYYVYIITNINNSVFYVGVTNDLQRRIYEHKHKVVKGFSSRYNLYKLVYFDYTSDIYQAIKKEKELKHLKREDKINLIRLNNPNYEDLGKKMKLI